MFTHLFEPVSACFRIARCWKLKTASKFLAKYTVPTVQKAEGLMVWAAMKSDGAICLRRCPPRLNAAAYQAILMSARGFIRPRCTYRGRRWAFQQDGASSHRANTTANWLRVHRVKRHNGGQWPPMSPDLNPIEHLWPMVLKRLEGSIFFWTGATLDSSPRGICLYFAQGSEGSL